MNSPGELNEKVDALWRKYLPTMRSRMETIHQAIDAMCNQRLTQDLRTDAAREAHKLAGSLGTFGLRSGSEAATEIERLLLAESTTDLLPIDQLSQCFAEVKDQVEKNSRPF